LIFDIQTVGIENFKSFTDPVTFDLKSYAAGLHFLRGRNEVEPRLGSNGAGKSSLIDAIVWCLYGRTPAALRNTDIIPWQAKQTTKVTIAFLLDEEQHTILRTANPNKLKLNNQTVDQDKIDKLLLPFGMFTHSLLMPQDQPLFFDLAPRDQLELFASVLNLERWDERSQAASDKTDELQSQSDTLNSELIAFDAQLVQIRTLVQTAQTKADAWAAEQSVQIEHVEQGLATFQIELDAIQKEHDTANLGCDSANTELVAIRPKLREIMLKRNKISIEYQNKLTLANAEITRFKNELQSIGESEECPTCGQSLRGTRLADHISELKIKLADCQKNRPTEPKEFAELQKELSISDKAEKDFQAKADKAQSTMNILWPDIVRLQSSIKALQAKKEEKRETLNPYTAQITQLERQRAALRGQQRDKQAEVDKLNTRIARVRYWIKGFKDIKLFIIEEVLQELEIVTNIMLEDVGLEDWAVRYDVERESKSGSTVRGLNVQINSPRNKELVKWRSFSGGENQRLRLIGALALSEVLLNYVGITPTLEILDEPSKSLSRQGVKDLIDYLADRAQNLGKRILLVDHHAYESSKFASVTTVVKDKSGSYIE